MIVDWKISHQLYSLNTGLNSDSPWYTYVQPNFVWPPDTLGKAPNYILLGKSSIEDIFLMMANGSSRCLH